MLVPVVEQSEDTVLRSLMPTGLVKGELWALKSILVSHVFIFYCLLLWPCTCHLCCGTHTSFIFPTCEEEQL